VGEQRVGGVTDGGFVSERLILGLERVVIYYYIREVVKLIQLKPKETIFSHQHLP